ncbi:hypothetical protein HPP92_010416 [Vanilla planifolia]|uniref:FLZ-type domain-containing protein n=1 Tax=Vanilla planifolia TaxID=51239 RepID=A0A835UZQ7_VANPL|nr:hypothetical protein HPP92_010416 [Vanilla planifolia]
MEMEEASEPERQEGSFLEAASSLFRSSPSPLEKGPGKSCVLLQKFRPFGYICSNKPMPKDVTAPLATPQVLALPTMAWTPATQSPWRFGGAIGLGIVAAMSDGGSRHKPQSPAVGLSRSQPIPIATPLLQVPAACGGKPQPLCPEKLARVDWEDEEFSECYTWVISHAGGYPVRRMVYFDDGYDVGGPAFHESPQRWVASPPPPSDFLSCCFLCRKNLLGLDIFMYRGEEAFCSAECRYQQMLRDEQREKKKK